MFSNNDFQLCSSAYTNSPYLPLFRVSLNLVHFLFPITMSLSCLKTGQSLLTGPPGLELGRANNLARITILRSSQRSLGLAGYYSNEPSSRSGRTIGGSNAAKQLADTISQYIRLMLERYKKTGTSFLEKSHCTIRYNDH